MTLIPKKTSRPHRRRKLAYAPLVAAVAAGALCAGAGIGEARTEPVTSPETISTPWVSEWTISNHTGQPISGSWNQRDDFGTGSAAQSYQDHPWAPDAVVTTKLNDKWALQPWGYAWEGHICYIKHWWDFAPQHVATQGFSLEVDSQGTLHAVYVNGWDTISRIPLTAKADAC
ncbi:hypothetical protein R3Q06_30610 [Rhodococcus erythropolis]|uniref:hypothetical protein n=1 Tax=Rhodococcus erythropolis TaxID=1833 RepID=UPI0029497902|nr:hypothetical protein [Rhodococcus erythropolis]MDV6277846.1 hypothetical protein [Rhodococcus erythropolis]